MPVQGDRAQPGGQVGQRAQHVGLDPLAVHVDAAAQGGGQRRAGADPVPPAEAAEALRVGPDPPAPQADHRALGLGQDGQLLVGELLAVEGGPPAQLAQRRQGEPGPGDGGRGGRGDLGAQIHRAQEVGRPQHLDAGRGQVVHHGAEQVGGLVVVQHQALGTGVVQQAPERPPHPRAPAQREQQRRLRLVAEAGDHRRRRRPQVGRAHHQARVPPALELEHGGEVGVGRLGRLEAQRHRRLVARAGGDGGQPVGGDGQAGARAEAVADRPDRPHRRATAPRRRAGTAARRRARSGGGGESGMAGGQRGGGRAGQQVGDGVGEGGDGRLRRGHPQRLRPGDGEGVGSGREGGDQLRPAGDVGGVERPEDPGVGAVGRHARHQAAPGNQVHGQAGGHRPRPHRRGDVGGGGQAHQVVDGVAQRQPADRHRPAAGLRAGGDDELEPGVAPVDGRPGRRRPQRQPALLGGAGHVGRLRPGLQHAADGSGGGRAGGGTPTLTTPTPPPAVNTDPRAPPRAGRRVQPRGGRTGPGRSIATGGPAQDLVAACTSWRAGRVDGRPRW